MQKLKRENKAECEFCHQNFKSGLSLSTHQRTNRRCVEIQGQSTGGCGSSRQGSSLMTSSENEAQILPSPTEIPRDQQIQGDVALGLYSVAKLIKESHMNPPQGPQQMNLMEFLRTEIEEFDNTCFDEKILEQLKYELHQWVSAEEYHINAVWQGIEQGVFNPARGRGGASAEQRAISAAYILAKWKKVQAMNSKHKAFYRMKKDKFRQYEVLEGKYEHGPVGMEMFGTGSVRSHTEQEPTLGKQWTNRGPLQGEQAITTVSQWCDVISWLKWKFFCLKKVVLMRLKHPMPLILIQDVPQKYQEIVRYLEASPFAGMQTQPATYHSRLRTYGQRQQLSQGAQGQRFYGQ